MSPAPDGSKRITHEHPDTAPGERTDLAPSLAPPSNESEGRFNFQHSQGGSAHPSTSPSDGPAPFQSTIDDARLCGGQSTLRPGLPPPAHRLGDYELLDIIGRGGMGIVYKARHLFKDQVEALKVIRSDSRSSAALRSRFHDEMKTLAKLDHAHIVKILTASEFDSELYFTMPFESGGDLAHLIRKKGVPSPAWAAEIVAQLAEAVAYAHQRHVIHCDLKPHNVLLSADGVPRITDFGLALLLASGADGRPRAGEPIGTPSYMPPEQAAGLSDQIAPCSDVYGLGAILYELLTHEPPFNGTDLAEILEKVKTCPPRSPRSINPAVPRRLEAICLKCLAKSPTERYASAGHLATALRGYLRPWWKRRWRQLAAATVIVFLGAGVTWLAWQSYQAPRRDAYNREQQAIAARVNGNRTRAINDYTAAQARFADLAKSPFFQPDRWQLRLALARVHLRRGELWEEERSADAALDDLQSARKILEALHLVHQNTDSTLLLAEVHHNLGIHFGNLKQWSDAEAHYRAGLRLREGLADTLAADRGFRRDLARSHGYLGDAQLFGGEPAKAWDSYEKAQRLRQRLAEESPQDLDALCLHARDFGNKGNYHDWLGRLNEALQWYRRRLQYYHDSIPRGNRLPGAYRSERADTALTVAELELHRPSARVQEGEDPLDLVEQAWAEYSQLLDEEEGRQASAQLNSRLAWAHVVRGTYYRNRNMPEAARKELDAAQQRFQSLDSKSDRRARPDDYYRWAVAYTLQGELASAPEERIRALTRALDRLERAVKDGYGHLRWIERDPCMAVLRAANREEFDRIVARISRPQKD